MAIAGIMLVWAGVLIGAIGKLAAEGKITRNGLAGIRTKRSMADDASWSIVHLRALPWMYASAAAMAAGGLAPLAAGSGAAAGIAILAALTVSVALMIAGTVAGHRELRRRGRSGPDPGERRT